MNRKSIHRIHSAISIVVAAVIAFAGPSSDPFLIAQDQGDARQRARAALESVKSGRHFIVTLDQDSDPEKVALEHGIALTHVYRHALNGFSATLPELARTGLLNDARVRNLEPDQVFEEAETQTSAPWGLDRIDQRSPTLDTVYTFPGDGTGVTAYMIGGGIRYTHSEFENRVTFGFDAYGDGGDDCAASGHGTRVAGVTGGKTYGVAKKVNMVVVKVNNCAGNGLTTSTIVAGVDWITANHVSPAVANLSLIGPNSISIDAAIQNMMASGVVTTIAAGNDNADACNYSPARVTNAITMAASDSTDARASFSNWGSCVDWFAPGVDILSASNVDDTSIINGSGTSFAAPFAAGAAAIYLQYHAAATQIEVRDALLRFTSKGKILNANTVNNHILFNAEITEGTGDTLSPTTVITSPADGALLQRNKPITIQASASDSAGVARVELFVDGVLKCTDLTAPYACTWTVPTSPKGATYLLQSKATDAAGNAQASPFIRVTGK